MSIKSIAAVNGLAELGPDFLRELAGVADRLWGTEAHADHLAAVLYVESKFNPQAKNPHGSATGILQWTEHTAKAMGTTTAELAQLSAVEQLPFVERYFRDVAKTPRSMAARDIALATLGKGVGTSDAHVLWTAEDPHYAGNKGLDVDGDGRITSGEVRQVYGSPLFAAQQRARLEVPSSSMSWGAIALLVAVLGAGVYVAWTRSEGMTLDEPIRRLLGRGGRRSAFRLNPKREDWDRVWKTVCGSELKARMREARRPCDEELAALREQAREERASRRRRVEGLSSKKRAAQKKRSIAFWERVEFESRDVEDCIARSHDPTIAAYAAKEFRKKPQRWFAKARASKGRTSPAEFYCEHIGENIDDVAARAYDAAERRGRRRDDEEYDEAPF